MTAFLVLKKSACKGVLASLIAGTLFLSGCSASDQTMPQSGEPAVTLEQAHKEIEKMLSATQEAVGGEWEVHDDTRPRGCTTSVGAEGLQFAFLRSTKPGIADETIRGRNFETVREIWSSSGYEVGEPTTESVGGGFYQMLADNGNGSALAFSLNETAMTIDEGSSCVPGTYGEYQEKLEEATGVHFLFSRLGRPAPDADTTSVASDVALSWDAADYSVSTSETAELGVTVSAENSVGSSLSFSVPTTAAGVIGSSSCLPGDFDAIIERVYGTDET